MHPVDVFLINLTRTFCSEALERRLGTVAFPFFMDFAFAKKTMLVHFEGIHAVILMITNKILDIITLGLHTHDIIYHASAIWTAVDVVAKKIELIFFGGHYACLYQLFQGGDAAVNIRNNPTSLHRKPVCIIA